MSDNPTNAAEAMKLARDWATGRRSWTNLGPDPPYTPDVIAVMDAQEVVKWGALAAAFMAVHSGEFPPHPQQCPECHIVGGLHLERCSLRPVPGP